MSASEAGQTTAKQNYLLQASRWLRCGGRLLQQAPALWFGMAGLYLVLGAVLEAIPFAGHLLFVLLSPMLLAGALYALAPSATTPNVGTPVQYISIPARQLLQAFAAEARAYPAILMGIMVVGLVVLLAIVQYFIGAGSFTAEWTAARHGAVQTAVAILRLAASGVLYALLTMALFYAVHRTVFGRREPMRAIAESFAACRRRLPALAVLALVFLVPYVTVAGAFQAAPWLGYVALFTIGIVAVPVLVLASYCSYRDVFGDQEPRPL